MLLSNLPTVNMFLWVILVLKENCLIRFILYFFLLVQELIYYVRIIANISMCMKSVLYFFLDFLQSPSCQPT